MQFTATDKSEFPLINEIMQNFANIGQSTDLLLKQLQDGTKINYRIFFEK